MARIIQEVNSNLWILFGYKQEELIGKNVKILMDHPHTEMHDTYLKRRLLLLPNHYQLLLIKCAQIGQAISVLGKKE